ncbi:MAG TPA: S41 family peptidase [Bryobacteraceae bacterium]|nr:S41 family peptidase [Bryobacteraceae bacterium]
MPRLAQFLMIFGTVLFPLFGAAPRPIDGIWQTKGYGYVFLIKGPALAAFELTTTTCVQGLTARQDPRASAGWDAAFKSKDEGTLFFRLSAKGAGDHGILHPEDSVPDISIDRIAKMPAVCDHPAENTPSANFEVFARTWSENYISFDRRHVDWNSVVAEYRPKVTAETTPTQLFEIFQAMIRPLGDIHTYIAVPALKRSTKTFWRAGTNRIIQNSHGEFADRGRWKLFAITNRDYLRRPPRMFCRRHLQFGHINDTVGYLRILSFGGYSKHSDLKALESALDAIFSDSRLKGLVIDMRLSFGGSDELGLAIARRLASKEYVAYIVQARSSPLEPEQWTAGEPIIVQPSSRPGFHGAVVELIGPITMSAAETFSEALISRKPPVTRIGENTQGVFCDILDRHLPNGWTFGLPNAMYRMPDGRVFDVSGIPPDIELPVFSDADVAAGKDPAMAKAVELLSTTKQ